MVMVVTEYKPKLMWETTVAWPTIQVPVVRLFSLVGGAQQGGSGCSQVRGILLLSPVLVRV